MLGVEHNVVVGRNSKWPLIERTLRLERRGSSYPVTALGRQKPINQPAGKSAVFMAPGICGELASDRRFIALRTALTAYFLGNFNLCFIRLM